MTSTRLVQATRAAKSQLQTAFDALVVPALYGVDPRSAPSIQQMHSDSRR
jgi:hypothetical protein